MGENEQGGMLRVVTVVGLIAIISMTLIFGITKLKTNLWKNTEAGVPPTAVIAALQPDQLTLSKTIYGESKNFVPNSPLEPNTVKTDDNMDVSIDTTHMKGRGWALVDSPHYALSDSVKRVKYVVIFAVIGLKNNMISNQTNTLQTVSKGITQKDIDFTMTGTNGKLDKVVSHTDLIDKGYFPNVLSGNDKNNDTSFKFQPYPYTGGTSDGMRAELYLNLKKINYVFANSNSDYLELSIDYTIKNAKSLTYDQATALNLDSRKIDGDFSGLQIGLRSDSFGFRQNKIVNLNGDMSGTLTLQAPKSTVGSTYEAYVILANTNFDSVKLTNLRISNASH